MSENIILSHKEVNGQIINSFVSGSSGDESLSKDSKQVKEYLKQSVLFDDMSVFKAETSPDFSLRRIGPEIIKNIKYVKYKIKMVTERDGEEVECSGYVWLESTTGTPLKLVLNVEPNQMTVKSIDIVTDYSVSDSGFLITDKVVTDIVVSIIVKKMFITNTIIRENYLKCNYQE